MNFPEILRTAIFCSLWGLVQACVALALPGIYAKVTRTYGIISLGPSFFIALIGGAILALIINPVYLIGVVLGIPFYPVVMRLVAHKH